MSDATEATAGVAGFSPYGDVGAAMPEAYGIGAPILDPIARTVTAIPPMVSGLVDTARDTPYGLRREDVTDIPGSAQPSDELAGRAFDAAMGVTGGAGIVPAEANALRTGIGMRGVLAGRDTAAAVRMQQFLRLENKGASPSMNYSMTGWYRGDDGQPRSFMSDQGAKLTPKAIAPEGHAEVPNMVWDSGVPGKGDDPGIQAGFRDAKLGDIWDHPDLYQRYPWLKDITVKPETNPGWGGHWSPSERTIYAANSNDPRSFEDVLHHEAVHAIQNYERFSPGSNKMNYVPSDYSSAKQTFENSENELASKADKLGVGHDLAWVVSNMEKGDVDEHVQPIFDKLSKAGLVEPYRQLKDLKSALDNVGNEAYQKYLHAHGESEARDAPFIRRNPNAVRSGIPLHVNPELQPGREIEVRRASGGRIAMADGGTPVTDPDVLAQLNAPSSPTPSAGKVVTDPAVLAQLNNSGSTEPSDHGLSERQQLSPVGKALSPITSYPATYGQMRNEATQQASEGLHQMLHPDSLTTLQGHGISDELTGAAKVAAGTLGYIASPISAAYRSFLGQPVEDVTGVPREYTEFAAQLATPYIGLTGSKLPTNPVVPPRPALPVNRFGVTESLGQASEDLPTIQAEQGAYRGQAGDPAQKHAVEFFDVQQPEQLRQAATNVSKSLDVSGTGTSPTGAPIQGQELASTPTDAASMVQKSLQKEAARQTADVKAKYDYAKSLPGSINADTFKDMPITIREGLSNRPTDPVYVDEGTPNAAKMLRYLNDRVGELKIRNDAALSSPIPDAISGVTLEGVEQWRKALSSFRGDAIKAAGSNASDVRASQAVMNEFDKRIADAVNSGAFTGDPGAVDAFNDARAAHAARMKLWGNDAIGRRLQAIIGDPRYEKDPATLNDVTRWLYGESGNSSSLNVGTVNRIKKILGDSSPEWSAIKQGLFRQITDKAGEARGYGSIASRLRNFLNGPDLANAVYSPAERDVLRAYADMHDRLNVPQAGANWPNTAAGVIPHVKNVGARITGAVGAAIGHMIHPFAGDVLGYVAGEKVGQALTKAEEARNYKQVANLLPIISQRFNVWQQAVKTQRRVQTAQNQARLAATATNLTNALSKLQNVHSNFAQNLVAQLQGPASGNAKEKKP